MNPQRWLRRIVRPEAFAAAMIGDLEETRREERARLGIVRAEFRHSRRVVSVMLHFAHSRRKGALGGIGTDLRSSLRRWASAPTIAITMVLSLTLGIGASAAVFSVVDGVLLRPLPYSEPGSLVIIRSEFPLHGAGDSRTSGPEFLDLEASDAFANVGVAWYRPGAMTDDGIEPEDVDMAFVSTGFLTTLDIQPLMGRLPTAAEDVLGGPKVVVLAHSTWQRRYGGDPAIVGRTIAFDDIPHTVVGVLEPTTRMLMPADVGMPPELAAWVPWGGGYDEVDRNWRVLTAIGRLAPGQSLAETQAALDGLATELVDQHSDAYGASGFRWRLERLEDEIVAPVRPILLVLLASVWLVLIVATANVANLMLARAVRDQHEASIRAALGASRWRVLRQALADSAIITGAGAAGGMLLAAAGVTALPALAPPDLPRLDAIALNWTTLGYAVALTGGTTLFLALILARQANQAMRGSILGSHRTTTGGGARTRQVLTVAQIALSLVLLVGAALLIRSFERLSAIDPGYDPQGVLTMKISLVDGHYPYSDRPKIADFYRQLMQRVEELPGVTAVGATSRLPLDGSYVVDSYSYEQTDGTMADTGNTAQYRTVTPGWFEAMAATLVQGRTFEWTDGVDSPEVVVIDDTLAARVWPDGNAVGQRLRLRGDFEGTEPPWAEVIGVVRHLRQHPRLIGAEQIYTAHQQNAARTMAIALRTELAPTPLLSAVRGVVHDLNALQPLQRVRPLESYLSQAVAPTRFALDLLIITAIMALALAAIGTYGIVSFMVNQRVREIGVRMAMGAAPADMTRATLRSGAWLIAAGVGLGVPAALAFATGLRGLLFGVSSADPVVFLAVSAGLAAIGLLACSIPARRASRLSPVEALRAD